MNPSETTPLPTSFIGQVKNGVIVFDAPISLVEGQTVRVEPLAPNRENRFAAETADRVQQLQSLFAEWTEEDGELPDEDADRLRTALEQNGGVSFRTPALD